MYSFDFAFGPVANTYKEFLLRCCPRVRRITTCRPEFYSSEHWRLIGFLSRSDMTMFGGEDRNAVHCFERRRAPPSPAAPTTSQRGKRKKTRTAADTNSSTTVSAKRAKSTKAVAIEPAAKRYHRSRQQNFASSLSSSLCVVLKFLQAVVCSWQAAKLLTRECAEEQEAQS